MNAFILCNTIFMSFINFILSWKLSYFSVAVWVKLLYCRGVFTHIFSATYAPFLYFLKITFSPSLVSFDFNFSTGFTGYFCSSSTLLRECWGERGGGFKVKTAAAGLAAVLYIQPSNQSIVCFFQINANHVKKKIQKICINFYYYFL